MHVAIVLATVGFRQITNGQEEAVLARTQPRPTGQGAGGKLSADGVSRKSAEDGRSNLGSRSRFPRTAMARTKK